MKSCNLGDSGFMLLRPNGSELTKVYRSETQQYYFDCPFQTGNHSRTPPSAEAFETTHEVNPNDIVVLGTDGLWDNLFDEDVISLI